MGASSSRVEGDKALQLCHERKKFVRQALDGRCSLAATHVAYIESLKVIGNALKRFFESEVRIESSLCTATSETAELLSLTQNKSLSQFSVSSVSHSLHMCPGVNLSPSPSLPNASRHQANHMKFMGSFSRKVEEKVSLPVMGSVTLSSGKSTDGTEASPSDINNPIPAETPPWDFFGLFHPIDNDFVSQDRSELNKGLKNLDGLQKHWEEEGLTDLDDEDKRVSSPGREEFQESEDEFDEPSADDLVRTFENINRAADQATVTSPAVASAGQVISETEILNEKNPGSPDLSPLRSPSSAIGSSAIPSNEKAEEMKEDAAENKVLPKDFISGMKDIEHLFVKASESGREVPRMLEANKFHFRPIFPGKERGSVTLIVIKKCFSCGDDRSQVQEEPTETATKYLTWHRTTSSHSSSSRNPLGPNIADNAEDLTDNLFDNFCMNAGSHASTLDRLYAWERKLYDEVKACDTVRRMFDEKRKSLRQLESNGSKRIDETRAIVKDLHFRIGVSVHRIDSISRKIEELRDKELQPQLEELIEGWFCSLRRMWNVMYECHKAQFQIISGAFNGAHTKISFCSDSNRQIAIYLESELNSLSSSFLKWIGAQKSYVQSLNGWLFKCVSLQQKFSKRKRKMQPPPLRNYGPPMYVTCGEWLDRVDTLPAKEVADSIRGLAAEIARFLPHQEKNHGKGMNHHNSIPSHPDNRDAGVDLLMSKASNDFATGFDGLWSSLVGFLGQLDNFAASSVKMFTDLQKSIEEAKSSYAAQIKSQLNSDAG